MNGIRNDFVTKLLLFCETHVHIYNTHIWTFDFEILYYATNVNALNLEVVGSTSFNNSKKSFS